MPYHVLCNSINNLNVEYSVLKIGSIYVLFLLDLFVSINQNGPESPFESIICCLSPTSKLIE